jgi:glucose-1-phosphate thymidylyltransferase
MGTLTTDLPKPLLPLAGRPILDYLLDQLLELPDLGALHIVSNQRYLEAFETWAASWRRRLPTHLLLEVHNDGSTSSLDRLGAVGDLAFALEHIDPQAGAVVAAGDNVLRFSLEPLWRAFRSTDHSQVLALREEDPQKLRRTGVLELGAKNRVLRLHEKPDEPPSAWACPSLYCLNAAALAQVPGYLAAGHPRDEIGRFIAHLVEVESVYAVPIEGERLHVGSPEAYRHAEKVLGVQNS